MTLWQYVAGVPGSTHNPSNDQPNMLINANSISSIIGVDHIGFNLNNGGYHTIIHQNLQGSDPAPIGGIGQIYSKNVSITNSAGTTTFDQLFHMNGGGGISQLTGSSTGANGYTNVAGLIIQWGVIHSPGATGTYLYNTAPNFNFPNAIYGIWLSPLTNVGYNGIVSARPYSSTTSGFGYVIVTSPANPTQVTDLIWMAIGS